MLSSKTSAKHFPGWAWALIVTAVVIIAAGITGGIMLHQHYEERHQEAVAFVKENRRLIDNYFSKADTVTIKYDKVDISPMGGMVNVNGYINHDPKLHFFLDLAEIDGEIEIGSVAYAPKVGDYIDRTN